METLCLKRNGKIPVYRPLAKSGIDLTGQRFGRWKVLELSGFVDGCTSAHWKCICDCGSFGIIRSSQLREGGSTSCGCRTKEVNSKRETVHGMCKSSEFKAWQGIRQRCENPNSEGYKDYGSRGIKVCERWAKFENFYQDLGPKPSRRHSVERKENNGDYCPENCVWDTKRVQANNRRNTPFLFLNGCKKSLCDWARDLGLSPGLIRKRKLIGWSDEKALTYPIRNY